MLVAIFTIGSAFVVSLLLTRYLLQPHAILNIMDHPNERSLHSQPVPRTGGVAIFIAIITMSGFVVLSGQFKLNNSMSLLGLGVLSIAFISFLDDRYNLSVATRFFIHFIAACLIVIGGWVPDLLTLPLMTIYWPFAVAVIFTVLFIVWMTNLYNFMDGMDGFAAGMAIFGFGTLCIAGYIKGDALFAITNGIIASSAAGFLVFNFPPARIFMGDMGSSTLGYLVAAMLLWSDKSQIIPLWLGVILFSPFIVDATVTLVKRAFYREKFWLPHKTHYYQRLVQMGWGHQRTVLAEYGIMLAISISVLLIIKQPNGLAGVTVFVVWSIFYILMAFLVQKMEPAEGKEHGNV